MDCSVRSRVYVPREYGTPEPHKWETRYDEITGEPYEQCKVCMTRRVPEKIEAE